MLVSTSVCHPNASFQAGIRATELVTGYLVEPLDSERSKLTYVCRVDMKYVCVKGRRGWVGCRMLLIVRVTRVHPHHFCNILHNTCDHI